MSTREGQIWPTFFTCQSTLFLIFKSSQSISLKNKFTGSFAKWQADSSSLEYYLKELQMCLLHTHVECIQTEMVQFLLSNEAALLVSLCWLGSKTQKIEQFHQGGNIGCASTDSNGSLQELLSVAHHPLGGGQLSILL